MYEELRERYEKEKGSPYQPTRYSETVEPMPRWEKAIYFAMGCVICLLLVAMR